jgi:hypothetical protein
MGGSSRRDAREEVQPLSRAEVAVAGQKVPGPPMSAPANRPKKPDGSDYRPGERLALAVQKMRIGP